MARSYDLKLLTIYKNDDYIYIQIQNNGFEVYTFVYDIGLFEGRNEKMASLEEALLSKDLVEFPKELDKKCTQEEFHKMMTSHNSDIPIDKVTFLDYPDDNLES